MTTFQLIAQSCQNLYKIQHFKNDFFNRLTDRFDRSKKMTDHLPAYLRSLVFALYVHVLIVHLDNFSGHTVSTAHYVLCGRCVSLAAAASQLLLSQLNSWNFGHSQAQPASSSSDRPAPPICVHSTHGARASVAPKWTGGFQSQH